MSQKITYTTLGSSEEFHRDYEAALAAVEKDFGATYPNEISGVPSRSERFVEVRSPIDARVLLGRVQQASASEAAQAVEAAHGAFRPWRDAGWWARVSILRRAAEVIAERKYPLAAMMAWETGKNRLESMGEVEESADLLRYYCTRMEENAGYELAMTKLSPSEDTKSVLRPYGVWAVISPFNFPMALPVGMMGGALITGNTVVFKPSHDAPITGALLYRALRDAGVPKDVLHLVGGTGQEVGRTIVEHPRCEGIAFTGSYEVGMHLYKSFSSRWPKPVIVEMGGKNPAIVTKNADLEAAAEGVARSAFGFGGQKCSACSRLYVDVSVKDELMRLLIQRTLGMKLGNPHQRDTFLGPVITRGAQEKFHRYVDQLLKAGANIAIGGRSKKDGELAHGWYVEPTIAELDDKNHDLWHEEMFLPILLVAPVADLEEALELSNRAMFGLTAGLFSRDPAEVKRFLDEIEAGVTYVNRKSGATTGAWPGVNPFGGWKGSGSTGPAALGPHYLLKFMREQSRTTNP